jgi:cyclomaltodextrinase / maltogenic alpha-amylase / neopullulanase
MRTLFLRGTLNNWAALDDYAFQYSCDAYYLNLQAPGPARVQDRRRRLEGRQHHRPRRLRPGRQLRAQFSGEHTLRLAWAGGRPQLSVGPKTFADPRAAAVTDPVALSLRFDSRAPRTSSPSARCRRRHTVDFALTAAARRAAR